MQHNTILTDKEWRDRPASKINATQCARYGINVTGITAGEAWDLYTEALVSIVWLLPTFDPQESDVMEPIGSTKFSYEDCTVQVVTFHLPSGKWDVDVRIWNSTETGVKTRRWTSGDTFQTKDEALSYGSALGKKLLDDGLEWSSI